MPKKRRSLPGLSQAQQELMEIIWQRGELSATQVRKALAGKRKLARNTVRTLLERMEDKGWLRHRQEGRTFFYSATQPREASVGRKIMEVVDELCGGSPAQLVTALLDYHSLTDQELDRIRRVLDRAKADRDNETRS
jgi:predicted transcriptional regulator